MADIVYVVIGLLFFALMGVYALACDRLKESRAMIEPVIGLDGRRSGSRAYLLYTLIYPEKF